VLNVVILAAGKGSRMCSDLPKVMHPLAGEPVLLHVISTAKALISNRDGQITVVTGYGAEVIDPFVLDRGCRVVHQIEQKGTGHALKTALKGVSPETTTLVLYGDVPLVTSEELSQLIDSASVSLSVLTAIVSDPTGYGRIIRDQDHSVVAITEERDATAEVRLIREVNSGIYAAPTSLFQELLPQISASNNQNEYYLTDCVGLSTASGNSVVAIYGSEEVILGVNDRKQLATLNQIVQQQRRDEAMRSGATLVDPSSVYFNGRIDLAQDVEVEPNVVFQGNVIVGKGSRIGFGSHLTDAIIGAGTIVKPYTIVESGQVGAHAEIGPFARIRPGSKLSDNTHLGNFCETKNAVIGRGSKINHLSYLGDTEIGERVNVGAGTITCNYDGLTKHLTKIGNDVFIGSNSSLVAPINIADQATIGAGSVITKDVVEGELALSRAPQVQKASYQRPKKRVE